MTQRVPDRMESQQGVDSSKRPFAALASQYPSVRTTDQEPFAECQTPAMPEVTRVDGATIAYTARGDDEAIVLVPGLRMPGTSGWRSAVLELDPV